MRLANADALDALTVKVLGRYGASERYPELQRFWVSKRLMYEDPLYLANYLYAGLIAVQLFTHRTSRIRRDSGSATWPSWAKGFDRPPQQQVEQLLNAKPDWPRLVEEDLSLFPQYLAQLQVLHAKIERQRGR